MALPQLVLEYPDTDWCVKSKKEADGKKLEKIKTIRRQENSVKTQASQTTQLKKRMIIRCLDHRLSICTNQERSHKEKVYWCGKLNLDKYN